MSRHATFGLGLGLASLAVAALAAILRFGRAISGGGPTATVAVLFGTRSMPRETDLLLLSVIFGALGSFVHVAKSFAGLSPAIARWWRVGRGGMACSRWWEWRYRWSSMW